MVTEVGALVLFSSNAPAVVEFYRSAGVALEDERHDEGPLHWACEIGPVHFAVYQADGGDAPRHRVGGSTFPGLVVESLDAALASVRERGAALLSEPTLMPWGRRAVVEDPDGRPVELYERG